MSIQERDFTAQQRKDMAASGQAMSDGSFPIATRADVANAVQSLGRASNPAAAKAHIIKRAKALGCTDMLPKDWNVSESQTFTESAELRSMVEGQSGREWEIKIIAPGVSKNGVRYTPEVLKAAVPLYEGAYSYERHSSGERSLRERIGRVHGVEYREGQDAGLWAHLRVINPTVREMLLEAQEAGELATIGFSHDVYAASESVVHEGRRIRQAKQIEAVNSVDMVERPSAGGRMARLVAGETEDDMADQEILAAVKEANAELAASMQAGFTGLVTALKEAFSASAAKTAETDAGKGESDAAKTESDPLASTTEAARAALQEAVQERQRGLLHRRLEETKLSAPGKARVKREFEGAIARRKLAESEIEAMVTEAIEYEGLLIGDGQRPIGNSGIKYEVGAGPREKFIDRLMATYAGPHEKLKENVEPFASLREAFCVFNGDWSIDYETMMEQWTPRGGYRSGRDHKRIAESITTASWGEINADVMYQRLISAYRGNPNYDQWRLLCSDIESVPDFRTRHWMRFGGYGDLPSVSEGATYQSTTSPTDEEVTYSIGKYGMLEDLTMETMANDQVGVVRRIPDEMGRAAARTLYKFVFAMVTTTNANMDYDTTALYHANHNNTGTTALSVSGLEATQTAMRDQTGYNQTSEILGGRNQIKYLIVPNELGARAQRIVNPSNTYTFAISSTPDTDTSIDPQRFVGSGIVALTADILTDATDWWAVANPADVPTVVMGFLGGRQEPELFVQDTPTVGSAFTSDKTTFKIRHIYGGDVLDHRSFYRNVVAG